MASPPFYVAPQPPPLRPPRSAFLTGPGGSPATLLGLAVFLVFVVVIFIIFFTTAAGMGAGVPFDFAPFCGIFVFIIILAIALSVAGLGGRRAPIPPPPPIQQPMVPAGLQGPVALNCPNCGAPPQGVDRFGVATCPYCNARFLVR